MSSIDISIMRRPALAALPASYSKRAHTFRTTAGYDPTARARLGSKSLVNLDTHGLPSGSLIPQHVSERRPTGIKHGFSKPCFSKRSGVHIADSDERIFVCQFSAGDMKVMPSGISDLSVDRSGTFFVARSMSPSQLSLILAVMTEGGNFLSIAARRQCLQAKINADATFCSLQAILDVTLKCDIPATLGIFHEGPSFEYSANFSRFPKAIASFEVNSSIAINPKRPRNEWDPSERSFRTKARPKSRVSPEIISGCNELPANRLHRIGMNSQLLRTSRAEVDQIKGAWPFDLPACLATPLCLSLGGNAEIPDLVARYGVLRKDFAYHRVFDPKFEGEDTQRLAALAAEICSHFVPEHFHIGNVSALQHVAKGER